MHLSAIAALMVLASSGAVSSPAHADTPTCDGKPATIVVPGSGNVTHGTSGDDVIVVVAEGAPTVPGLIHAYEGDDTVCIVPGTGPIPDPDLPVGFTIRTGPGKDRVINQEPRPTSNLLVVLGLGSDTYIGNDRSETVYAGENVQPGSLGADDAKDFISTAAGMDWIYSGSTAPGSVNEDVISTGTGSDEITYAGTGTTIDNGVEAEGGDRLNLLGDGWSQRLITIDNRTGTATADTGVFLRWNNVRLFVVRGDSPLRFVGSDTGEGLYVRSSLALNGRSNVPVDASMNGGNDYLWFYNGITPGRVDGGEGTDRLTPEDRDECTDITATLNATMTCTVESAGSTVTYNVALAGWERYETFHARRNATITGTTGPDKIFIYASNVIARGLSGGDTIAAGLESARAVLRGDKGLDMLYGSNGKDTLLGGRGADKIDGREGRDRIVGGKGNDTVKGNAGTDYCIAEVRRSCEKP
jgi:Ca2+-binding RTX toxin-like protein